MYNNLKIKNTKQHFSVLLEKSTVTTHMQVRPYFSQLLPKLCFMILSFKIAKSYFYTSMNSLCSIT